MVVFPAHFIRCTAATCKAKRSVRSSTAEKAEIAVVTAGVLIIDLPRTGPWTVHAPLMMDSVALYDSGRRSSDIERAV